MYLGICHEVYSSSSCCVAKPRQKYTYLSQVLLLILLLCQSSCLSPPNYNDQAGESAGSQGGEVNEQIDQSVVQQVDQQVDQSVDQQVETHDMVTVSPDMGGVVDAEINELDMEEPDAGLPPPDWVTFNLDGDLLIASSSRLRVVWDPNQGFAPVMINRGDGLNFVWTGQSTGVTSSERLVGVLFFDEFNSWQSMADYEVLHQGPGVIRLKVSWEARGASDDANMSGITIWTIHDDGRLMRDERIQINYPRTGWLVGYHSIPIDRVDRVSWNINGSITSEPVPQEIDNRGYEGVFDIGALPSWLCVTGTNSSLLFSAHSALPSSVGHRATWSSDQSGGAISSLNLQFDWLRNASPSLESSGGFWWGSLFTGVSTDCQLLRQYLRHHNDPSTIELSTGTFFTRMEGDNDQDGYHEGGGFYVVEPTRDEVAFNITPMAPPSFTILIKTEITSEPILSTGDGELPPQSFVSSLGEEGWYVHVRHPPFSAGGSLTVTFPSSETP